jgi:FKBP-type peptidyl-prolyl cis-trans isomerase
MRRGRGQVQYEELVEGAGAIASRGSEVEIRYSLKLNQGEVVQAGELCTFRVGSRQVIAGLEYGVESMKVGGVRHVRVGPHLGYHHDGVPGVIPPDAILDFTIHLLAVRYPLVGHHAGEPANGAEDP